MEQSFIFWRNIVLNKKNPEQFLYICRTILANKIPKQFYLFQEENIFAKKS